MHYFYFSLWQKLFIITFIRPTTKVRLKQQRFDRRTLNLITVSHISVNSSAGDLKEMGSRWRFRFRYSALVLFTRPRCRVSVLVYSTSTDVDQSRKIKLHLCPLTWKSVLHEWLASASCLVYGRPLTIVPLQLSCELNVFSYNCEVYLKLYGDMFGYQTRDRLHSWFQ